MWQGRKVSVVFPACNEEENVRHAIEDFLATGYVDEIIVVDNNSTDNTRQEVEKTKAKLVSESKQGFGHAFQRGLREATGELIFMAEPDGTFFGKDVLKLLAYIDDFDFVLGTRTSKEFVWRGANMGFFLRWGNWVVAKKLEVLFNGPALTDCGCSFRLIKKEVLDKIIDHFTVGGSHFLPETTILAIVGGLKVVEVPVNYSRRSGASKITGRKSRTIGVGLKMVGLILKYRIRFLFKRKP